MGSAAPLLTVAFSLGAVKRLGPVLRQKPAAKAEVDDSN